MDVNRDARRARIASLYRRLIPYSIVLFAVSLTVCLWNLHAISNDIAPNHILPLVKVLSGTAHSVPVAYQWTIYLTALSVMSTFITGGALIGFSASLVWRRFFS